MSEGSEQGPEQGQPAPMHSDAEMRAGLAANAARSENHDMGEAFSALHPPEDAGRQQELFQDLSQIQCGEELTPDNEKAYASTFNKHGVRREQAAIFLENQNISDEAKERILDDITEQSKDEQDKDTDIPADERTQLTQEGSALMDEAQQTLNDRGADLAARQQDGEDVTQELQDLAVEQSRYEVLKEKWKERGIKVGKAALLIFLLTILAYIYALSAAGKAVPKR